MNAEAFKGNQWDRILGSDEYTILYHLFRSLAFLVDKLQGKERLPTDHQPKHQYLRRFANLYLFL
jgi:uncharacterized protein YabN with tetrapyrrole methylase and pyrophosphatase domain